MRLMKQRAERKRENDLTTEGERDHEKWGRAQNFMQGSHSHITLPHMHGRHAFTLIHAFYDNSHDLLRIPTAEICCYFNKKI